MKIKKSLYPMSMVLVSQMAFASLAQIEKTEELATQEASQHTVGQQKPQSPVSQIQPEINQIIPDTENAEAFTYRDLYRDNVTIEQKWAILNDLKEKSPEFAKKIYLSCIESTDWMLRVGGLKFLATLDAQLTLEKAKKLLQEDASLLVRSAAVDVIIENGLTRSKESLWQALQDAKNFHKGHSLWVRKNIAEALKAVADQTENSRWAELLNDKDMNIREYAVEALEKSNNLLLGSLSDTLDKKVEHWKNKFLSMAELNVDKSSITPSITEEVKAIDPIILPDQGKPYLESKEKSFGEEGSPKKLL